jgi:hypothetical protein
MNPLHAEEVPSNGKDESPEDMEDLGNGE